MPAPEALTRETIDRLLEAAGWAVQDRDALNLGASLGVAEQSAKYSSGIADTFAAWREPLPFSYESTGVETHFTNGLDPTPRSRRVFSFHRPEPLLAILTLFVRSSTLAPY